MRVPLLPILLVLASTSAGARAATATARADDEQNFGFERASPIAPTKPALWFTNGAGYEIALDTVAPHGGRRSLRMHAASDTMSRRFGVAVAPVPLPRAAVAGHTVRLSGWTRTANVASGYAGLWMRVDGPNGRSLALDLRAAARDPQGAWLAQPHRFRSIGAVAVDAGFASMPVARYFDVLIYFDQTTPSHSLGRPAASSP